MKEQSEQDFIVEQFSYESLEKLSKAELIDIVYRLQDALVDLRVMVCGYAKLGAHKPLYEIATNIETGNLAKSWDKAECKKIVLHINEALKEDLEAMLGQMRALSKYEADSYGDNGMIKGRPESYIGNEQDYEFYITDREELMIQDAIENLKEGCSCSWGK
ncbi:MAG: hypothetical protein ACI3U2_09335 [Anaerovibrio sp.]